MPEEEEWQRLASVILHWNSNRLDLFEISQPSKTLDFNGVMRFYLEGSSGSFATKCLRVGSSSTTRELIQTLLEKFRPDMKILSTPYCLYEVHGDVERKLDPREKPLVVQLKWNSDNREGRFVLRNQQDVLLEANCHEKKEKGGVIQNFKRTLSRKEKKNERKKDADLKTKGHDTSPRKEQLFRVTDKSPSDPERSPGHSEDRKLNQRQFNPGEVFSQSLRPNNLPKSPQHGGQLENTDQLQLPIGVKFRDNYEETFLSAVINYTNSSTIHFKLSHAYVLYMAARQALGHAPPDPRSSGPTEDRVSSVLNTVVSLTETVVQKQRAIAGAVAFWMANTSELLNFIKQDKDLSLVTPRIQESLAHLVHKAFKCLIHCLQVDLRKHMPAFLIDPEQRGQPPGIEGVVNTLVGVMSLLRRCLVNPALTIQLFSQLFHFVSAWLFNRLMGAEAGFGSLGLLSHYWGAALRQRLAAVEDWAERQGLELAADCHLGRIIQATTLLTMNKYSMQDAKDIQATCFKLNSLQLKKLMSSYLYAPNEPHIPPGLIDSVVSQSEASEDDLAWGEGRDVGLEESLDLQLPFLVPEGGYACASTRGVPHGFREFLEPLCRKGLCTLISHPHSNGTWTVFFSGAQTSSAGSSRLPACGEPEVVTVTLKKPLNSGMGVSIVAAKAAGHGNLGIYVRSVVKGGPAEMDGRLAAGDQLLSVDGQTLVGLPQERAAGIMMQTGPIVTLQVAKLGACYHGLDALLHQPPSITTTDGNYQSTARPTEKALFLNSATGPSASGLWGNHHGTNRRKKGQVLLKNRPLYRSNPNMIAEDPGDSADTVATGGRMSAVSTSDLCSDACPREYLTLPPQRSQHKKAPAEYEKPRQTSKVSFSPLEGQVPDKRTWCDMRHARSHDNLCMEPGAPLVDKQQRNHQAQGEGQISHYCSFPISPSISTHDLHYKEPPSTKHQQGKRASGSGYWRTPALQNPVSSIQPIRIDIPATRPGNTHAPLATFSQNTTLLTIKLNQNPESNERAIFVKRPGFQTLASRCDAGRSCSANRLPPPTLSSPPPQHQLSPRKEPVKPQIVLPPTRRISPQKQPDTTSVQKDLYSDIKQELSEASGPSPDPWKRDAREASGPSPDPWKRDAREASGPSPDPWKRDAREASGPSPDPWKRDAREASGPSPDPWKRDAREASGPSPDPWKRDAREKLEEQQRLQAVDLLQQEVEKLWAKAERTPEDSARLRRLSLEWQFQKRLQEFQQSGDDDDDDDDEEEDEDVRMFMRQLEIEDRTQRQDKENGKRQQHITTTNQEDEKDETHLSRENMKNTASGKDQGSNHFDEPDLHMQSKPPVIKSQRPERELQDGERTGNTPVQGTPAPVLAGLERH